MSRARPQDRSIVVVRIMALICVALGLMCAGLAWAWTQEREIAACWRTAAMFQLVPADACGE